MNFRLFSVLGAVFCGASVVLGAFGAHALKETLSAAGTLDVWKTAVQYQFFHAMALMLLALFFKTGLLRKTLFRNSAVSFGVGIVLFSGSLYWLSLGGPRWLGPITPIGGLAFIAGWVFLAFGIRPDCDEFEKG